MDRRLRNLWRIYHQDPTIENRTELLHFLRKIGSPLGNRLVFEVHEAANRARAGNALPLGLTSRLAIAHKEYKLDRYLAGAVYAGLEREDLSLLLDSLQISKPIAIYSPSGFAFQEVVANWLECDSMYGDYEDFYLVSENKEGQQEVTRVMHFCPDWDNTSQSSEVRIGYIGEDTDIKYDGILSQYMAQNYEPMSAEEIREALDTAEGSSLAIMAADYARATQIEVEHIVNTLSEFKHHFILWLAMESRGWLD